MKDWRIVRLMGALRFSSILFKSQKMWKARRPTPYDAQVEGCRELSDTPLISSMSSWLSRMGSP